MMYQKEELERQNVKELDEKNQQVFQKCSLAGNLVRLIAMKENKTIQND